jgi:hypothetical protein
VAEKAEDFHQRSGLEIDDERVGIIAEIYLKTTSDINTSFEDFLQMYNQIKMEESTLLDKLEISITFDDSAIDEIIRKAVEEGKEAGPITFQLAKKLEYGLKLVRERSGMDNFVITREAVTDMESYINGLVKRFYQQEEELSEGERKIDGKIP